MYLSEIQQKDLIDLETGVNLGKIVDAQINEKGEILTFTAEPKHFFKHLFKNNESIVSFTSIVKIGTDVILVNVAKTEIKS